MPALIPAQLAAAGNVEGKLFRVAVARAPAQLLVGLILVDLTTYIARSATTPTTDGQVLLRPGS